MLTAATTCGIPSSDSNIGMPARLRQQASLLQIGLRIDQHNGDIRRRSAGRHVARVLLMPRRVGNDELPLRGRKIAVRHIDGDALLALGLQSIGQQRKIDMAARGPVHAALLHRRKLVLVDALGVVQQPSDQRALAVVDAAGRRKAQHLLLEMRLEKLFKLSPATQV